MKPRKWGTLEIKNHTQISQTSPKSTLPNIINLDLPYLSFGRKSHFHTKNSDILFPNITSISRFHCAFEIEGNEEYIIDLGSTYGTFLNYKKIVKLKKYKIKSNDIIIMGSNMGDKLKDNDVLKSGHYSENCCVILSYKKAICDSNKNVGEVGKKRKRSNEEIKNDEKEYKKRKTELNNILGNIEKLKNGQNEEREKMKQEKLKIESERKKLEEMKESSLLQQQIENELKCSICGELVLDATILQCSHNFCRNCIIDKIKEQKEEKRCPKCNQILFKKPFRNYGLDNLIEKISQFLSKEEQERIRKRKERILSEEHLAIEELQSTITQAEKEGYTFFSIENVWSDRVKGIFKNGMKTHKGKTRKQYLALIGFTGEWIQNATVKELKLACSNLDLFIHEIQYNSTGNNGQNTYFDESIARRTVKEFYENEYIDLS